MNRFRAVWVLCVFAMVGTGLSRPAQAEILTATLLEDTFVQGGLGGDGNYYSDEDTLWVRNHSTVSRLVLAQFELPPLPAGWTPSTIFQVRLSGTVNRCTTVNQELEMMVLGTNPDLTTVAYNDVTGSPYNVITGRTDQYNFTYGDDATLVDTWTGLPLAPSMWSYYPATYVDTNAVDGLLHWVQETISDTEPTKLTLGFGPRGSSNSCDFRFWSMEGAAGASNDPPAGFLPAIPLTLTLIPEPSTAVLGLLALAGGLVWRPRRRARPA